MINGGRTLMDDGHNEWYTVIGFWFETMERWAESYYVDTARAAEEAAQEFARNVKFLNLGVTAVLRGKIHEDIEFADGYATYVDPDANSKDEMAVLMEERGLWKLGENVHKKKKDETKWWQRSL